MSQASLADAFSDLCRRAASGPDALPDGELLRRYAAANDQAAFAALLRRHGRLVWGAALRRTADRQMAEDVFQATFLALARRAGRLDGQTSLAGWLYTVGVRLARRAARRPPAAAVEHIPDPQPGPLADLSARELLTVVDDELGRLPERLRLPVVLCCLDGLSRDEAAQRLGCSFQVLKGRLERGRELLRKRLVRRGLSLPAALGGLVVLPVAVPPDVSAATAAAVRDGTARPAVTALAQAVTGTRPGLILVLMAGVLGLGLSLMPSGAPPKPADPPAKDAAPAGDTVAVRVLADGKPAHGAQVWVTSRRDDRRPEAVLAGADGLVRVPLDAEGRRYLSVFARGPDGRIGEARLYEHDLESGREPVVHLLPVGELTGRFTTADGKPIAGAALHARQFQRPDKEHEPARPNHVDVPHWDPAYAPKTDADGRFRIPGAPLGYKAYVTLKADGFGHGTLELEPGKPLELTLAPAGAIRIRLAGDAAATKGLRWSVGMAVEPGRPRPPLGGWAVGELDGSAEYRIPNLPPGKYRVELRASARAAVRPTAAAEVTVPAGGTVDLPATLEPMARTTGRVVDARTGKGIPKALVSLYPGYSREGRVSFDSHVETDADGRFVAYGPPGEWVRLALFQPPAGYARPDDQSDPAKGVKLDPKAPHDFGELKLRPTLTLTGVVVDDAGKPVARPAVRTGQIHSGEGYRPIAGKADGTFAVPGLDPDAVLAPRVKHGRAVNVPTPIEVDKQKGPATIPVSEKNACRVRGRVTDAAGKPLAGATVGVTWNFRGLGREATYGMPYGIERVTTDADGRFESGPLWPGDSYSVSVTHDGYGRAESKQVPGEAGQVHDLGTVALVPTGLRVRGRVVGLDGQPVAGVTMFNRGDGPRTMTTMTGPDGTFELSGFFDAPAFVFARKDGHRFAHAAVRPGGHAVTVTLRKVSEPAAPLPAADAHEAAVRKFTRWLLERLWAERAHTGGYERNVFSYMARFDPAAARKWQDEEKTRTGGKADYSRFLAAAEQERTRLELAAEDLDEALAQIPKGKGRWDVDPVLNLGEHFLKTDKAKALRAAEEAAARARALDPADRAWVLARVGDLAVRSGNAAGGKKLIAEAADLAGKLPADANHRHTRDEVAALVAPHDEPAAHRLIEPFTDPDNYSWALAGMIDRIAETDPDRAEALLPKLRPQNGFSHCVAPLAIAYRVAAADPDRAERLVNAVPRATYRVLGLARLATLVKDRERAWKLIDRAMELIEERPDDLRGWSGEGGEAAMAAVVAVRGRMVGHPDVSGLVGRALAQRPTEREEPRKPERDRQTVFVAVIMAFADPAAARTMLGGLGPPAEYARRAGYEMRNWVFAAAMADPDGAPAAVEAALAADKMRGTRDGIGSLIGLASRLTEPGDRIGGLSDYARMMWGTDRPR
jgi:RNA polymerase sigma factor (sigma-70 family)